MGRSRLFEELRADVLGVMNDGANFYAVGLHGVEERVRLKAKTSIACRNSSTGWPMRGKSARRPKERTRPE